MREAVAGRADVREHARIHRARIDTVNLEPTLEQREARATWRGSELDRALAGTRDEAREPDRLFDLRPRPRWRSFRDRDVADSARERPMRRVVAVPADEHAVVLRLGRRDDHRNHDVPDLRFDPTDKPPRYCR